MATSLVPYTSPYTSPYSRSPRRARTKQGYLDTADTMAGNAEAAGDTANDAFLTRATQFDPTAAYQRYARGAWGSISDALGDQLRNLRDQSVGAGRLDTGFYDEDTGKIYKTATDQLSRALASGALQATGQDLQNTSLLGQYAGSTLDRAGDLNTALFDEKQAEENARKKRSGGIGSAIGSLIGGVAGTFLGPIGGGLGAKVGGAIGGAIGS